MDTQDSDYPGDASTPGTLPIGGRDYGYVSPVGDVDWFKVTLMAGQQYRFEIEAGSINGLFDPQLGVYSPGGQLIVRATVGQGFQSKYVTYTPTASGDYFLAASGDQTFGSYALSATNLSGGGTGGTGGGNPITGTSGNDTLMATSSNDTIDGGGGTDTVFFGSARSNYTVTRTSTGYTVKANNGSGGTDTLTNVEKLEFADANPLKVNLTVQSAAAGIAAADLKLLQELYVAFFNRVPDADGLEYWIGQFKAGMSVNSIADAFYNAGTQYTYLTGYSATMSNADFVNVVYKNVLGRTGGADAEGLAYWTGALASGKETKGSLVSSIIGSAHTFKGNSTWGWVADLLDNKAAVADKFAVFHGLSYNSADTNISEGMKIAAAVTPTDTAAAIALIGVPDALMA